MLTDMDFPTRLSLSFPPFGPIWLKAQNKIRTRGSSEQRQRGHLVVQNKFSRGLKGISRTLQSRNCSGDVTSPEWSFFDWIRSQNRHTFEIVINLVQKHMYIVCGENEELKKVRELGDGGRRAEWKRWQRRNRFFSSIKLFPLKTGNVRASTNQEYSVRFRKLKERRGAGGKRNLKSNLELFSIIF